MAQVFVKIANRSKIPEINEQLLQIPNLLILTRLIGSFDVLVLVALEDFGELFKLKEGIHRIPGIEETYIFKTQLFIVAFECFFDPSTIRIPL
jgi:DNA-binding Lrp family transcriptional regulator